MIIAIKKFFENKINPDTDTFKKDSEHAIRLATAALLIEVSRADYSVKDGETDVIVKAIQARFNLSHAETEEILCMAEEEVKISPSYHEFTSLINREFSPDQKRSIIEHLWEVAIADGEIEKHEEHLIRKIANLLYVPHKEFIDAKLKVKRGSQR